MELGTSVAMNDLSETCSHLSTKREDIPQMIAMFSYMALPVMEIQDQEYKIRKIFA